MPADAFNPESPKEPDGAPAGPKLFLSHLHKDSVLLAAWLAGKGTFAVATADGGLPLVTLSNG